MRKEKFAKAEEREANGSVAVTKIDNDNELRVQITTNDKHESEKAFDNPTFISEHLWSDMDSFFKYYGALVGLVS